jgi:hypothetical protein
MDIAVDEDTKFILEVDGKTFSRSPHDKVVHGIRPSTDALDLVMLGPITAKTAVERTWIIAKVANANNTVTMENLADYLSPRTICYGVSRLADGSFLCIVHKLRHEVPFGASSPFPAINYWGTSHNAAYAAGRRDIADLLQAMQFVGEAFTFNYVETLTTGPRTNAMASCTAILKPLTEEQSEMTIGNARLVPKAVRTPDDWCMITNGALLLSIKKRQVVEEFVNATMRIPVPAFVSDGTMAADNGLVPNFRLHTRMHELQCFGLAEDCADLRMDLWSALADSYQFSHTLVFLGPPRFGKTPTALAVAAFCSGCCKQKYFVKAGDVDSLKDAGRLMQPGVAIFLDEWQASGVIGSSGYTTSVDDFLRK